MDKVKSKIFLLIFLFTSVILALGAWNNYRPQVVYASCADIAEKTTNLVKKKEAFEINDDDTFDQALNNCLMDAGYFESK